MKSLYMTYNKFATRFAVIVIVLAVYSAKAGAHTIYILDNCSTVGSYSSNKGTSGSEVISGKTYISYSGIDEGTSVTLTATPEEGFQFDGWTDEYDYLFIYPDDYEYEITLSSSTSTTATFSMPGCDVWIYLCNFSTISCSTSPTVTAGSNSSIGATTATVTCASGISSLGSAGCSISEYGFVLNTSANPTTSNTKHVVGTSYASTGTSFSKNLTNLSAGTTYYVRPFAINGNGTAYGTQTSFTTLNVYDIDLDKNGGSEDGLATVVENATSIELVAPTRTGYHVEGYYTTSGLTTKIADDEGNLIAGITVSETVWTNSDRQWKKGGDAKFYTKWTANTYKVVFNNNGGTGSMSDETGFTYGTAKALTACSFTAPEHKYFIGWNTNKDATTALYEDEEEVSTLTTTNNGTVTLYAIWKEHTYKNYRTTCAIYDITLDDGLVATTNNGSAKVSLNSKKLTSLVAPTKTGYTVEGYYTTNGGSTQIADAEGNLQASVEVSSTGWTNSSKEWILEDDATFYAAWEANTYTISLDNESPTEEGSTSVTLTYASSSHDGITNPTKTGYTFGGWYSGDGGTGELVIDDSGDLQKDVEVSDEDWTDGSGNWIYDDEVTLYANWAANNYTVTLDNNDATSGSQQTVSATFASAMPLKTTADGTPAVAALSRTGYTFTGWWDATSGGNQYYSYDGSSIASARNWDKASTTTLKAQWSINSYTLTWALAGGTVTVAGTGAAVNATGSPSSSVEYNAAITTPTVVKEGYTFNSWSSTPASNMPAANTTYTASWTINDYNIAVVTNDNVTITATPASGDAIAEGSNADVNYNKNITLNYSSLGSGLTWGGWRVYKADDASTTVTVTSNQFTMPAYDVKVEAIVYSVGIAWCDPDVEVTGDVHLTSYNGISVNSTSAAGNLIEISSSDMGSATKMEVAYLNADAADAEVDKDESVFRFCNNGTTNYNVADENAIDLDYEWGTSHSIKYTPNAYDQRDNYKLQLTFKRGDKVLKTVTHAIYGRSLPEEFVIASKYLEHWYALPNTMGTATETVTPILITVDNTTTPTEASYAPSTAVYKGADRKRPGSNVNSIRLTNDGSHWLITNNSNAQLGLSATETEGYENREVWYLKSSNFGVYELAMDPAQSPSKKLGMYSGNMGMYADPAYTSEDIYLLPITNKYTPIDATATDWTGDAIGVTASTSATKMGIAQEDGTETDPVTLSSSGTSHAADFDGDIDFTGLTGEKLLLKWYDGSTLVGGSQVTVPSIIEAGDKDDWSDFASAPTLSDIVVLSKPMTIDEVAKAKQIVIDQSGSNTGKLVINADQSLIVDGKISKFDGAFGGTSASDLAILSSSSGTGALITGEASDNTQAAVQFYSKARYESGYVNQFIGVPLSSMTAYNGFYGTSLRVYDDTNDKWQVLGNNAAMYPFTAYNLMRKETSAGTLYMEGALNLPGIDGTKTLEMGSRVGDYLFANSWTAPIDVASMDAEDFENADATIYIFNAGTKSDYDTNHSDYENKKHDHPGQWLYMPVSAVEASPEDFSLTVIPSMQAFMVKSTAANARLTLDYEKHVYNPAKTSGATIVPSRAPRRAAAEEDTKPEIVRIRVEGTNGYADDLLLFLREDFSTGYDNGWEAFKVAGKAFAPQLYAITEDGKKAISAQPDAENTVIGFKAGTEDDVYTFTLDYEGNDASLYLHDTYTDDYVRVEKDATYTFLTTDNTDHPRFVLTRFNAPQVTTGVDDVQWNGSKARKLMIDGILYIIRDGRIYNAEGALVK